MAKKTTTEQAPTVLEHITIEPIKGNKVRLTADEGWLVRSKNTGHTWKITVSCHPEGYEAVEEVNNRIISNKP